TSLPHTEQACQPESSPLPSPRARARAGAKTGRRAPVRRAAAEDTLEEDRPMTHRLLPGMVLGRRNFGRMVAGAAATASFGLPFAARAQDVRVVRLAHHVTVDSAQHAAAEDFA